MRDKLITIVQCVLVLSAPAVLILALFFGVDRSLSYEIVFIPKVVDVENGFWTSMIAGARLAASENDVHLEVRGPDSEDDVETQRELLYWAQEQKPDAVMIAPNDHQALDDTLDELRQAGIHVILVDSVVADDVAESLVASDNVEAGRMVGNYARQLLGDGSRVGIVGHVKDSSTAIDRERGILTAMGVDADKVYPTRYCNSSFDRAYQITKELLADCPDVDIVIGTNEYAAVGAARAIKDLQLQDKIHVLGFDSSLEETQLLEEGVIECTVIQRPFNMGYLGMGQAMKAIDGRGVASFIDSGCTLITKQNMYEDENQKLLYPFVVNR